MAGSQRKFKFSSPREEALEIAIQTRKGKLVFPIIVERFVMNAVKIICRQEKPRLYPHGKLLVCRECLTDLNYFKARK